MRTKKLEPACPATPELVKPKRRPPGFTSPPGSFQDLSIKQIGNAVLAPRFSAPIQTKHVETAAACLVAPALVQPRRRPGFASHPPGTFCSSPVLQMGNAAPADPSPGPIPVMHVETAAACLDVGALVQTRRRPPGFTNAPPGILQSKSLRQMGNAAPAPPSPAPIPTEHVEMAAASLDVAASANPRRRQPGFTNLPSGTLCDSPVMQRGNAARAPPLALAPTRPVESVAACQHAPALVKPRRRPTGFSKPSDHFCKGFDLRTATAAPASPQPTPVAPRQVQPVMACPATPERANVRRMPPSFPKQPTILRNHSMMQVGNAALPSPSDVPELAAHAELQLACPKTPEPLKPRKRPPGFTTPPGACCNLAVLHARADTTAGPSPAHMLTRMVEPAAATAAESTLPLASRPKRRQPGFEAFPANFCNPPLLQNCAAADALRPTFPLLSMPQDLAPALPCHGKPPVCKLGPEHPASGIRYGPGRGKIDREPQPTAPPGSHTPDLPAAANTAVACTLETSQTKKPRSKPPGFENFKCAFPDAVVPKAVAAVVAPFFHAPREPSKMAASAACMVQSEAKKPLRAPQGFEGFHVTPGCKQVFKKSFPEVVSCIDTVPTGSGRAADSHAEHGLKLAREKSQVEVGPAVYVRQEKLEPQKATNASATAHVHCSCVAANNDCLTGSGKNRWDPKAASNHQAARGGGISAQP